MDAIDFYKMLADETRLKTLLLINREGELCVCELCQALQLSQPKISRHLALLRNSNMLQDRRDGKWIHYGLQPQLPLWMKQIIELTTMENKGLIDQELKLLQVMGNRPERKTSCC